MKILVTGGCGFIGSHLVDALVARGDTVVVLDDLSSGKRSNLGAGLPIVEGSVIDPAAVARAVEGCDGVVHLAAIASVQRCTEAWADSHAVNVAGTVRVLQAARDAGRIPVVYASSAAVYGDNPNVPLVETEETRPLSAYGADKVAVELQARVAGSIHGVPTFGLRIFNAFGPRQDPASPYSGVISIFAARLARGQGVTIQGDGGQVRDFIYVSDVVAHLLAALERADASAPVVNVCTGTATTILTLAETLRAMTGGRGAIDFGDPRSGDIRVSVGDPRAAERRLGLGARTDLAAGLAVLLRADDADVTA